MNEKTVNIITILLVLLLFFSFFLIKDSLKKQENYQEQLRKQITEQQIKIGEQQVEIKKLERTRTTIQEIRQKVRTREQRFCDDENVTWFRTRGTSMIPFNFEEARSFKKINGSEVKIGDTIIYRRLNKTIHHSIYNITEEGIITYGYGNNYLDNYITGFEDVLYVSCTYGVPEELRG